MARSNLREWVNFKWILRFSEEDLPKFTVFLGEGGEEKVQYGPFPCNDFMLPSPADYLPLMGTRWRRIRCRYSANWDDLCIEISGQVSGVPLGCMGSSKRQEEMELHPETSNP